MKRPVTLSTLVSILVLSLLPAAASADDPELLSREYFSPVLSRHALEASLWEACPKDVPECAVYDSRTEGYTVRLVAPPEVQRKALEALLQREQTAAARRLRLDLVAVIPGGGDLVEGLAPAAVGALEPLRGQRPELGFHYLDTAFVETADEAMVILASGERSFRANARLPRPRRRRPAGDRPAIRPTEGARRPARPDPPHQPRPPRPPDPPRRHHPLRHHRPRDRPPADRRSLKPKPRTPNRSSRGKRR